MPTQGICLVLRERGLIDDNAVDIIRVEQAMASANPYLSATVNYYALNSQPLVDKMLADGEDWNAVATKVNAAQVLFNQGKTIDSWMAFLTLIHDMMHKHWPDCGDFYWKAACGTFEQAKARLAAGKRIDDGSRPEGVRTPIPRPT